MTQGQLNSSLIKFANYGNLPMVKALVQNGADVRYWDEYVLSWDIQNKHLEVVQYLQSLKEKTA